MQMQLKCEFKVQKLLAAVEDRKYTRTDRIVEGMCMKNRNLLETENWYRKELTFTMYV